MRENDEGLLFTLPLPLPSLYLADHFPGYDVDTLSIASRYFPGITRSRQIYGHGRPTYDISSGFIMENE